MWVGWDLTVFQGFFKASGEKASLQEAFLGSTGGDELGTGCFGGTSHPRERSVGEREACPTKSPSCLHGVGAVTGSKWESGRVRGEGGGMLPGPVAHAGLCGAMAGRTGMTPLCSPLMGCGPACLAWGH